MCFKLQRNGTENGSSCIKDTYKERFYVQISNDGYLSFRHVQVKYKYKVPDISLDSNQNVETSCKSKFKLSELKGM